MWGPVGLTLALSIGCAHFNAFLGGARKVDRHMRQTSGRDNLPWMLALLGHWNQNVLGFSSHAVIPYAEDLARLPAYLQQADMESNGKSITRSGTRVSWPTGTACQPTCNKRTWKATGNSWEETVALCLGTQVRLFGGNRAPTASTPSFNCSTKARPSILSISLPSRNRRASTP